MKTLPPLVLLLSLSAIACGGTESSCDLDDVRARLAAAMAGETVGLDGSCTIAGALEVPAGVILAGGGATVIAETDGRGLTLVPSADTTAPTSVRDLTIESADGCAAVVAIADGEGAIALRDLDVRADTGVGIALQGLASALIERVTVAGPVTAENAASTMAPLPPFTCGSGDIATHGVVLVDVASTSISDSTVSGFGRFGLLAIDSGLDAMDLGVQNNLGAGLEVWGGTAMLTAVTVERTGDGSGAIESYGVLYGGGAVVDAQGLSATAGAGYGVFAESASATHDLLEATDNGFAGVWVQNSDGFSVSGAGTMIAGNAFAGVSVLDSMAVSVSDAVIADTAEGIAVSGLGTVMGADGVHAVGSQVTLGGLSLVDNPRVGAVFDLDGGATDGLSIADVTVDGSGAAFGVVAQNGTELMGWDDGVMRLGDTPDNDEAFAGGLGIAEGVGPPCLPPLDGIESGGIANLVTP